MSTPPTPTPVPSNPQPLQFSSLTKQHFESDAGIASLNLQMIQIVNEINKLNGVAGKVQMPRGIDVNGSTVSGVGEPASPTDAVSQGHVSKNYSASAVSPQLDLGGKNALKGLTSLKITSDSLSSDVQAIKTALEAGISGTVTLAKLTGGGTNGSITFVDGIVTAYTNPT